VIVPGASGNASDSAARASAQTLSTRLGQQFVVETRTGAGGIVGSEAATSPEKDQILGGTIARPPGIG